MSGTVETYELDYRQNPPAVVRRTAPGGHDRAALHLHHLPDPATGPDPGRFSGAFQSSRATGSSRAARSSRAFQLTADDGTPVARVLTEQPLGSRLTDRPGVYRVEDPHGTPLARITVRRRRCARLRWTVEPVNGPVLHGYKGRLVWWAVWWPLGLPLCLLFLVSSLLGDGDGGFRAPRRIIWRDASRRAHISFRGFSDEYAVRVPGWDPRLVAALAALHQSFDPADAAGSLGWYAG
ncbi:hypothetical protein [Streptomyces sp. NPDC003299]